MLFVHSPKPMTFIVAIDAIWERQTDQRRGKGDCCLRLPWRRDPAPRGDRSGCRQIPSLLCQAPTDAGPEVWEARIPHRWPPRGYVPPDTVPSRKVRAAGRCVTGLCGGRAMPGCPVPIPHTAGSPRSGWRGGGRGPRHPGVDRQHAALRP